MNLFVKVFLVFFVQNLIICGTNSEEFACTTEEDCESFEDKTISSMCDTFICQCLNRRTHDKVDCTPKVTKVANPIDEKRCPLSSTEYKNGSCVTSVVYLGKACDDSNQCMRNDKNSECNKGICGCKENYREVENLCRSLVQPGRNCTASDKCIDNAICHNEECVCNKNFISSSDMTKCLPFVGYNDKCSEDLQCEMVIGKGAVCDNQICACGKNYTIVENEKKELKCQGKIREGDSCVENSDCSHEAVPKMRCHENKCRCSDGYQSVQVNDEGMCVKSDVKSLPSTFSGASSMQTFSMLGIISLCLVIFNFDF